MALVKISWGLYWLGQPQLPVHRSQMEIHISDWTHKFQNKTGLNAKANSELYKSNQVITVHKSFNNRLRP
jgi:hypothetical protein